MKFAHTLYRENNDPDGEDIPVKVVCEVGGEPPSFSNGWVGELTVDVIEPAGLEVTDEEHAELLAEANRCLRS